MIWLPQVAKPILCRLSQGLCWHLDAIWSKFRCAGQRGRSHPGPGMPLGICVADASSRTLQCTWLHSTGVQECQSLGLDLESKQLEKREVKLCQWMAARLDVMMQLRAAPRDCKPSEPSRYEWNRVQVITLTLNKDGAPPSHEVGPLQGHLGAGRFAHKFDSRPFARAQGCAGRPGVENLQKRTLVIECEKVHDTWRRSGSIFEAVDRWSWW